MARLLQRLPAPISAAMARAREVHRRARTSVVESRALAPTRRARLLDRLPGRRMAPQTLRLRPLIRRPAKPPALSAERWPAQATPDRSLAGSAARATAHLKERPMP